MATSNPSAAGNGKSSDLYLTDRRETDALKRISHVSLRKILLKIHLYIALGIGVLLVLAGVTGSLLVYKQALDKWLNPELLLVTPEGNYKPYFDLIEAANDVSPIKDPPHHLYLPRNEEDSLIVRYQVKHPGEGHQAHNHHFYEVMVNPYSGNVLGHRDRDDALMTIILQLHYKLLSGDNGKLVMGIVALLALILTVTGIYLWWPKLSRLKQAFVIKRAASTQRFNYDLHKTTGIYSAVILFAVALSGVYFNLPQIFKPVINYFSTVTEIPRDMKSSGNAGVALSPENVIGIMQAQFPGGIDVQRIFLPAGKDGAYMVSGHQPAEFTENGRTLVWVDQYSGKVIDIRDPHKLNAGDAFINLQLALHNGEILGQTGQILVLIAGFTPLGLMITGVVIWLRKRKSGKIEARRVIPSA